MAKRRLNYRYKGLSLQMQKRAGEFAARAAQGGPQARFWAKASKEARRAGMKFRVKHAGMVVRHATRHVPRVSVGVRVEPGALRSLGRNLGVVGAAGLAAGGGLAAYNAVKARQARLSSPAGKSGRGGSTAA